MKRQIIAFVMIAAAFINAHAWIRIITDGNFEFEVDTEKGTASIIRTLDTTVSSLEIPRVAHEGSTKYLVNGLGNDALKGCSEITSLIIPDNITSIYKDAFEGCTSLKEIEFSPGKESIVFLSLWGSSNDKGLLEDAPLEKVSYSRKSSYLSIYSPFNEKPTLKEAFIGKEAESVPKSIFKDCVNLETLELEEGISEIEWYAFSGCTSLREVKLPGSLTAMGNFVFSGCNSLEEIEFPATLHIIPSRACNHCTALKAVVIPEGVQAIDEFAFYDCPKLTSLHLPSSIAEIGDEAFRECKGLTTITVDALTPPQIEKRTFYEVNKKTCALIVPDEALDAYRNAPYWSEFLASTAIISIEARPAEGSEEWYTLDGIRLPDFPVMKGIYVLRKEGKASVVRL